MLAARWHHRLSTDLDFFVPYDQFVNTVVAQSEDVTHNLRHVAFGTFVTPDHMQCVMRDESVEVSISVMPHGMDDASNSDMAPCGVATQSSRAILIGKLAGRMMRQGRITTRDVYDICVAEREAPLALRNAAAVIPAGALKRSADLLTDDVEGQRLAKPLIDPKHTDVANNLVDHGRRTLLNLSGMALTIKHQDEGISR